MAEGYLDCEQPEDIADWIGAKEGAPDAETTVGWRISFGRQKLTAGIVTDTFTTPNWLGAAAWFKDAARAGHPSALNNLGVMLQSQKLKPSGWRGGIEGYKQLKVLGDAFFECGNLLRKAKSAGDDRLLLQQIRQARQLVAKL